MLHDQLNRDLQADQGLTIADYEILVRLSDAPERQIRMSELAEITLSSRSRLSHQIDRMEKAGLVSREICDADRRGQNCILTDKGWKTLVTAAPSHVESVREHFVDLLTDAEYSALGKACEKIVRHLESNNP